MSRRQHPGHLHSLLLAGTLIGGCKPSTSSTDSCFGLDQPILTPNGPVPIGVLRVGDVVWSVDPATGRRVLQPIARVIQAQAEQVLRLRFADRVIEAVTGAHPFFDLGSGRWIRAANLRPGLDLACDGGTVRKLLAIDSGEPGASMPVRTLSIDGEVPTYIASGVVVHNKSDSENGFSRDSDGDGYFGIQDDEPAEDCDDTNPNIHPAAPEDCTNSIDDDCDELIDQDDPDCQDTGLP